jgi:hypothetical protein
MAQPTPYTRQYNFDDWQEVNPSRPLPSHEVEAELDAIRTTIEGTRTNIGLIQRDDGALRNLIVTPESLSAATLALIAMAEYNPRGPWTATTAYLPGDVVEFNLATYLCLTAHTSTVVFADDLDDGYWLLLANGALSGDVQAVDLFEGDGVETEFTLSLNYAGNNAATVFVAGVAQIPAQDFTIVNNLLTLVVAPAAPAVPGNKNIMVRGSAVEVQLAASAATQAALDAQGYAAAALISANNADVSEAAADADAATATTQAGIATTQAGIATAQAVIATTQAGISTTQAGNAATSAGTATTQAGNAATSAATATTQAGIATTQAGNATTSAATATTQAGIATTQAGTATTQAGIATTQAGNASASAAAAAASALASAVNAPLLLTGVAGTNTITANTTPTTTAYSTGQLFKFIAINDNTGAMTVNVDGVGAAAMTKNGTEALAPGDVQAGQAYLLLRDAVGNFQLSGGSGGGATAGGVFYECGQTLLDDYTIPANTNAISGQLAIASGKTLTISAGAVWSIV